MESQGADAGGNPHLLVVHAVEILETRAPRIADKQDEKDQSDGEFDGFDGGSESSGIDVLHSDAESAAQDEAEEQALVSDGEGPEDMGDESQEELLEIMGEARHLFCFHEWLLYFDKPRSLR